MLHVDQESDFGERVAEILESEDERLEVVSETNAQTALDRVREESIDCIVADLDMPEKHGLEFLRTIRADEPDFPFILYVGNGSEAVASEAISGGGTDYIRKEMGSDHCRVLAIQIVNAVKRYDAIRRADLSHRVMQTARQGLSLVNPDGRFKHVIPAFEGLFGYEPTELVGKHWKVLYHNEEAERLELDILPAS